MLLPLVRDFYAHFDYPYAEAEKRAALATILRSPSVVRIFFVEAEGRPVGYSFLSFYVKQDRAMSQMLQQVSNDVRKTRFRVRDAPVEIVCGTVDRFQGREADLVMLSMRNTRRVGFLDSPNRLNVAVTRARQQLVVVGNAEYFDECGISELEELAKRTPRVDEQAVGRWKRGKR